MKRIKYLAIFGIIINGLATLRGLSLLLLEFSNSWYFFAGIAVLAISMTGLHASRLILKRNLKGCELASKQVWAAALSEVIGYLVMTGASGGLKFTIVMANFILAKQISEILSSQETKDLLRLKE